MTKTFAIDPGPHTGIFWQSDRFGVFQSVTLDFTDEDGKLRDGAHLELWRWLMRNVDDDIDRVVLERFEFRKDDAQNRSYIDYSPAELVGVVKMFCQSYGIPLTMQGASEAKSGFWADEAKLKKVGIKWNTKHEKDAARHWLYHRTFTVGDNTYLYRLR